MPVDSAGSSLPTRLDPDTLYLIVARLSASAGLTEALQEELSRDEVERAGRFVRNEDRSRHILGRGIARRALARILDRAPSELAFGVAGNGKPVLAGGPSFNIAHSGDVVAVALAGSGRVGVDVEYGRSLRDLRSLARTTFREEEFAAVMAAPEEDRSTAFYRVWTRKEAMLKGLGCGLSELHAISVSAAAEGPPLLALELPGEDSASWELRSIDMDPSHPLALAWDQPIRALRLLTL